MSKIYYAKRRREDDEGNVYWDETGFKLLVKDDGKMSLFDGRTGEWFSLFEPRPRQADDQSPSQQSPAPSQDDDIPF